MATNHMITVLPDGTVKGTVYTLAGGGGRNPDVMRKNDPYEDNLREDAKGLEVQAAGARPRQEPAGQLVHGRRLSDGRSARTRQGRQPTVEGPLTETARLQDGGREQATIQDGREGNDMQIPRWLVMSVGASVLALAVVGLAQSRTDTLTAMDYIEIQQLVAKYPYALDTHGGNGYMYADLFTPDGTFGNTKGREALAMVARTNQPEKSGPAATRHFLTNVIITPTADGAVGRQYNVLIDVGDASRPSAIDHGGHYEDVYVKTPAGWRFKSRTYVRSKLGPKPNPPPPSR